MIDARHHSASRVCSPALSSAAERLRGCIEVGFGTYHAFNQVVRRIFVEKRDAIYDVQSPDASKGVPPRRKPWRQRTGVRKAVLAQRLKTQGHATHKSFQVV